MKDPTPNCTYRLSSDFGRCKMIRFLEEMIEIPMDWFNMLTENGVLGMKQTNLLVHLMRSWDDIVYKF